MHASVRALALQSGGKIYVGGDFLDAGGHANADYFALWDGSDWTPLGEGLKDSVHALAIDSGSGRFMSVGPSPMRAATWLQIM